MNKKYMFLLSILLGLASLLYCITNLLAMQFASNFLAFIVSFLAAAMIFLSIKKDDPHKTGWYLLAFVCLNWAIADTIWFVMAEILHMNPLHCIPLSYLYAITNILLLAAGIYFFATHFRQWHLPQLIADASVSWLIVVLILTNNLLLHIDFGNWSIHEILTANIYIVTNTTAFVLILTLISSARVKKLSRCFNLILLGYIFFIFTDLSYVYTYALNTYQPNKFIDSLYALSMACFGFSAMASLSPHEPVSAQISTQKPQNLGTPNRLLWFFIVPLLLFLFGYLDLLALIMCLIALIVYRLVSGYIQTSMKNELLLKDMKHLNEQLEEIVAKRTEALQTANVRLEEASYTDPLTQMRNRHAFTKHIETLVEQQSVFSVFYMDFDHFKVINDLHGHAMGDQVLRQISQRFFTLQHHNNWFFRLGGDEFSMLLVHQSDNATEAAAENMQMCLELHRLANLRMEIDGYVFQINISIGTSTYPFDTTNSDTLIRNADLAMYHAKKSAMKSPCLAYSAQFNEAVERRKQIEFLLRTIDYDNEFSLVFQPQIHIQDNTAIAAEALLRWHSPLLVAPSPAEFLEIAAETDLIVQIGNWVIDHAFAQISRWNRTYDCNFTISVNLSPLQFVSANLAAYIQEKTKQHQILPQWIIFEITETHILNTSNIVHETFTSLSKMGFRFSVDNFGSGYSSLTYLTAFPVQQLKLSKDLVRDMNTNQENLFIIKAILFLAKGLNIEVIAEGVDSFEQAAELQQMGCQIMQGNHYSAPLTSADFEQKYLPCKSSTP